MNNLICYDFEDKVISHFTQWDINHTITIKDLNLTEAPIFHFSNKNSEEALCVQSEIDDNGYITARVPNILLREAVILDLYIYVTKNNTGTTAYKTNFAVRPKPKPADYTYSDNVEVIYIEDIMNEIKKTETALSDVMNDATVTLNGLNAAKQEAETLTAEITDKLNNGDFVGEQGVQGEQGMQGEQGNDGFSPVVSVTPLDNGHKVIITDSIGDKSFNVLNGAKGEQGLPGKDGTDYTLTDSDKQEIADIAVNNASEAASNANAAAQAAQDIVDLMNEKLANGEFNGTEYVLTSADKTEIAKMVEPLAESMQSGTVTYEIPKEAYTADFFAFDRNNITDPNQTDTAMHLPAVIIELAEMILDGEKCNSDIEAGILQLPEDINDWTFSEQVKWYEENFKPYMTVSKKPWCSDMIKSLIYYALRCPGSEGSDLYPLQQIFRNDMKVQIAINRKDKNEETIVIAQPNLYTAENADNINFFYPYFAVYSESYATSQTFKFKILAIGNCPKYQSDNKYATSDDTIEEVSVTFIPNNTFMEADKNESV